jgi:hypothetical protein
LRISAIPSVAMNALIRSPVMTRPFTSPTTAASPSAASTAGSIMDASPAITSAVTSEHRPDQVGDGQVERELIELTGLARSTVAGRVDALLASGLVVPSGEAASTGGRPPTRFAFNPAAKVVLAADVVPPT